MNARRVLALTGGSGGIGAAIVRLAATRGYDVAFSYQNDRAGARDISTAVEAAGGRALAVRSDASDPAAVAGFFDAAIATLGRLDAVVLNAGITGPLGPLDALGDADLEAVLALNVRGAIAGVREAAKRMALDRGGAGGAIVTVSSRASVLGSPNDYVHYAASKGAVDSLTIGAARELGPRGIRVNAVSPGVITTPIHARAGAPDRAERIGAGVPLGRAGSAEEVAYAVLWLLSDEAAYVTGAIVPVSGGR